MQELIETPWPYRLRALLPARWARLFNRDGGQLRVLIISTGQAGHALQQQVRAARWQGWLEVAVVGADSGTDPGTGSDNDSGTGSDIQPPPMPELAALIHRARADEVWIALPLEESRLLPALMRSLQQSPVAIRWAPDLSAVRLLGQRSAEQAGVPMIELNHVRQRGLQNLAKLAFDRVFALAVLLLLAPLLLALAIAIKHSSDGPVLFRQPRLGLNGKPFKVYKFRSMRLHHEQEGQVTQARRDDPRVTRIGRLMRRTSLDELPQFINVLLGQMSVVGPRPHALAHNDYYQARLALYMQRHRVKPGITGWAQIHGCRGETDSDEKMAQRLRLDLHYIRHWSFWLDLKIITWTALHGWTDGNAY